MARIAYLCTDLLFTSKIRETARALGHDCVVARDPEALAASARGAAAVVVDLRLPSALEALAALRRAPETRDVPAIGFCDHERAELMEAARAAGCDRVVTKGRFAADFARLLDGGAA